MGKKVLAIVVALVASAAPERLLFPARAQLEQGHRSQGENSQGDDRTRSRPAKPGSTPTSSWRIVGKGSGFSVPKTPTFDADNVTGLKEKLMTDSSIGDLIDEQCSLFVPPIARQGSGQGAVWRTEGVVTRTRRKLVVAKLKAKRNSPNEGGEIRRPHLHRRVD